MWDKSADKVKSPVVSIDLKNERGELLNVFGLSEEIELNITSNRPPGDENPTNAFVKPSINGSMQYHSIIISSAEMTLNLKIVPQKGTQLRVYVRHLTRPKVDDYDYVTGVPDFSSCKQRARKDETVPRPEETDSLLNCTKDPFLVSLSSNLTGFLGLHFVGILLPRLEVKQRKRRECSDSTRQRRSELCMEFKDPPTTPPPTPEIIIPQFDPRTDANYSISVSMGTCVYWSESKEKWTSEGCRVSDNLLSG